MRAAALILAAALAAAPVAAPVSAQDGPQVTRAKGAVLRALDKVTGQTRDLELAEGASAPAGRITVTLGECRYPTDDPASNAFAFVSVVDDTTQTVVFEGWMIAAAPALSAMEHPRYDVWLIRCTIPEG